MSLLSMFGLTRVSKEEYDEMNRRGEENLRRRPRPAPESERKPWFYNPFLVILVIFVALWLFRALAYAFAPS